MLHRLCKFSVESVGEYPIRSGLLFRTDFVDLSHRYDRRDSLRAALAESAADRLSARALAVVFDRGDGCFVSRVAAHHDGHRRDGLGDDRLAVAWIVVLRVVTVCLRRRVCGGRFSFAGRQLLAFGVIAALADEHDAWSDVADRSCLRRPSSAQRCSAVAVDQRDDPAGCVDGGRWHFQRQASRLAALGRRDRNVLSGAPDAVFAAGEIFWVSRMRCHGRECRDAPN